MVQIMQNKASSLLQLDGTAGAEANRRYRSAFSIRSAEKSKAVYRFQLNQRPLPLVRISLTPIKLVQLHGALANGGKLVTPHVVQGCLIAKASRTGSPRSQHRDKYSHHRRRRP